MPTGSRNATQALQRMMDNVLCVLEGYSSTWMTWSRTQMNISTMCMAYLLDFLDSRCWVGLQRSQGDDFPCFAACSSLKLSWGPRCLWCIWCRYWCHALTVWVQELASCLSVVKICLLQKEGIVYLMRNYWRPIKQSRSSSWWQREDPAFSSLTTSCLLKPSLVAQIPGLHSNSNTCCWVHPICGLQNQIQECGLLQPPAEWHLAWITLCWPPSSSPPSNWLFWCPLLNIHFSYAHIFLHWVFQMVSVISWLAILHCLWLWVSVHKFLTPFMAWHIWSSAVCNILSETVLCGHGCARMLQTGINPVVACHA